MLDLTQSWVSDIVPAFLSLLAEVLRPEGVKGAPLFSVSIGRPRKMMMRTFSVCSRFSDLGRKGAPLLLEVSIGTSAENDDVAFLSLLAEVLGPEG